MVKVLPEPVTPNRTCVRSLRLTPSTSSRIASGWSPFGSNSDWMTRRLPPSDFLRARRAMRRPRHGGNFRPALAQQAFKRFGGGGDAHATQAVARLRQVGARQAIFRVASSDLARAGRGPPVAAVAIPGQFRIEPGDRRGARRNRAAALPRNPILPDFGRRLARLVGGGKIGAAVERIVRRRLQARIFAGAGTQARGALVDRRIEQIGERVRRRRRGRPRRLGARRVRGVSFRFLRFLGGLRHWPEYGASSAAGKGRRPAGLGPAYFPGWRACAGTRKMAYTINAAGAV